MDVKCQKRSHTSCLEDIQIRHWNISMKQYKRHLMFGHQPARPETIEYQYFGTRWKSIQHEVKIKRFKLRYNLFNDLSKVWNLMAVPCPSWVCPWQIGKLPPNHEVRIIPKAKYLRTDWYRIRIFNFDLHFCTLSIILFSFVIHKREDEGDWTKVTLLVVNLPIIVIFKTSWEGKHSFGGLHNCD